MVKKNKRQLIEELANGFEYDKKELNSMSFDELQELYDELHNTDLLFPNGRDYDAEDEEGV